MTSPLVVVVVVCSEGSPPDQRARVSAPGKCICVNMYIYVRVCVGYVRMYVYVCVCGWVMYVCICVYVCVIYNIYIYTCVGHVRICVYTCVCMYVYIGACVCGLHTHACVFVRV